MTVEHDQPPSNGHDDHADHHDHKHDGVRGSLAAVVGHSRDPGDSIDEALTADARGIRVVKVSLAVLAVTAAVQWSRRWRTSSAKVPRLVLAFIQSTRAGTTAATRTPLPGTMVPVTR